MRWLWTPLLWIVACASDGSTTAMPSANSAEQAAGGDATASEGRPGEDAAPAEALRPEDAVGFARMDPSLDEMGCLPPQELTIAPRAWRLDGATLVWVPCRAGAYQTTGALFVVHDDGVSERLSLPYADAGGVATAEATGEIRYDPSTGELVDLVRFRGVGDCGRRLRFRVTTAGLTLLEHREQPCTDDGEHGGPETWPVRFPPAADTPR